MHRATVRECSEQSLASKSALRRRITADQEVSYPIDKRFVCQSASPGCRMTIGAFTSQYVSAISQYITVFMPGQPRAPGRHRQVPSRRDFCSLSVARVAASHSSPEHPRLASRRLRAYCSDRRQDDAPANT